VARLVLVGLPGAGKTTVAGALARRWECPVIDLDDLVARDAGVEAAAFLRSAGEGAFRRVEAAALVEALAADAVVATGGGVVVTEDARALLGDECTLWLDADDATLCERVAHGDRPLLGEDCASSMARLRLEREPLYRSVARVRVDASGPVEEVVDRLVDAWERVAP